jgi:hypothetical protein
LTFPTSRLFSPPRVSDGGQAATVYSVVAPLIASAAAGRTARAAARGISAVEHSACGDSVDESVTDARARAHGRFDGPSLRLRSAVDEPSNPCVNHRAHAHLTPALTLVTYSVAPVSPVHCRARRRPAATRQFPRAPSGRSCRWLVEPRPSNRPHQGRPRPRRAPSLPLVARALRKPAASRGAHESRVACPRRVFPVKEAQHAI